MSLITPNMKGNLRLPFLRMKWKLKKRALIKDAYYSVRSIKEIIERKEEIYRTIIIEERQGMKNQKKINELEGQIKCLSWLFTE